MNSSKKSNSSPHKPCPWCKCRVAVECIEEGRNAKLWAASIACWAVRCQVRPRGAWQGPYPTRAAAIRAAWRVWDTRA